MKEENNKQRIFDIIQKIDNDFLNEAKGFTQLRKLNKKLYDETINLEEQIGDKILKLIDEI